MDTESRGVWILIREDRLDNQILGVFATADEAHEHLEQWATKDPEGAFAYGEYAVGWHQ